MVLRASPSRSQFQSPFLAFHHLVIAGYVSIIMLPKLIPVMWLLQVPMRDRQALKFASSQLFLIVLKYCCNSGPHYRFQQLRAVW
jgi:hypothetical protein